jgi:hypothetical protein
MIPLQAAYHCDPAMHPTPHLWILYTENITEHNVVPLYTHHAMKDQRQHRSTVDVHRPVQRNIFLKYNQQDAPVSQIIYSCKTLYMFRTVFPFIIRSSKLHIQQQAYVKQLLLPAASGDIRYCYPPLSRQVAVTVWQIPDSVDTVDDGWWYHPKHVEQFPDKINCVTLHFVGYILEYSYNAQTHER